MTHNSMTLVLGKHLSDDASLKIISEIVEVINKRLGTGFVREKREEREEAVDYSWIDVAPAAEPARLVWCEDRGMNAQYVEVACSTNTVQHELVEEIKRVLPVLSISELLAEVDCGGDSTAVARLALSARGQYNAEVAERIESAMQHPDSAFRAQAQMAVFLLRWAEFKNAVSVALEFEKEPELRAGLEFLSKIYGVT